VEEIAETLRDATAEDVQVRQCLEKAESVLETMVLSEKIQPEVQA